MTGLKKTAGAFIGMFVGLGIIAGYQTTRTKQLGFDGVGMQITDSVERLADRLEANKVPPAVPLTKSGDLAVDAYQNVQVLGHLTSGEFIALMNSLTAWVSPAQGCGYCHVDGNLASDDIYTKVVARRMLQMTQFINENLQSHVKQTGVTCYTCHRGQPVPRYVWFEHAEQDPRAVLLGNRGEQNRANLDNYTSLPFTAFENFLLGDANIRIQSDYPLPADNHASIKQTEWTYSLMMHFSRSLGVNCTYCHNSRAWEKWDESPGPRATAWHGIRMVRHLNEEWMTPLTETFPAARRGPTGDAPKINCATCHQGAYKPLLGKSMLPDFPPLARATPQPAKSGQSAAGAP